MTSTSTDRIKAARSSLAIKAPVLAASTAALTLSGEQTVDGVALVTGDRVLVKNQGTGADNGIYIVDTGTWTRAPDANGNEDFTKGSVVLVVGGTTNSGFWQLTTAGTITIGTTTLTFATASLGTVSAFMTTVLAAADATSAFALLAAAATAFTGDISPTALAANTDDWAPTGFATASTVRVSSSSAVNLTGIAAGSDGRFVCLHNVGAFAITLKDNVTSTAANRFQTNGDYVLNPDASVAIQYDSTSSRWRVFGQQGTQASVSFNRLLNNVGLTVTMAANAATIALTDSTGADPSANSPCVINVRDGTLANGKVTQLTVQAALSTVISSGSTGGTTNAVLSRIWIAAINAGGSIELAWINPINATTAAVLDENSLISTTAEGGAGAADTAGVWYSTTARTNVAFTLIGYFESTQATAGTWVTAAAKIAINPAVKPQKETITVITSGSGTYTTPTGATRLRVRAVGAGGGGAASASGTGSTGNNTTFGGLTAAGGVGGVAGGGGTAGGGAATGGDLNINGQSGSSGTSFSAGGPQGSGIGGSTPFFGGGGPASGSNQAGNNGTSYGAGGSGGGATGAATTSGGGGASGGYVEKLYIAPAASYSYAVGAGAGGGSGSGQNGGSGMGGVIIIEEYYD